MYRRGFTLVELMITVLIVSTIGIYMGYALNANERAYQAVDQTAESQQNLRAVLDLIERDIRHTALMMPEAAAACGIDSTSGPDTLYLADGSVVDPGADTSEYGGVSITSGAFAAGTPTITLSSLVVEEGPPLRAAVDTDGDSTNDSDFRPNGGIIFFDRSNPDAGVACARITAVNAAASSVSLQLDANAWFDAAAGIAAAFAAGSIRAVPANEYRIVGTDLEWNGIVLAGNMEDLQVAWIFDPDGDNVVDAGEIYGQQGGNTYDSSGNNQGTNYENAADLRELRINLVARTRRPDETFSRGIPQALENRNGAGFVNDGFRRRVMISRIRLRNLGVRGG